jgi:hypothetical protein
MKLFNKTGSVNIVNVQTNTVFTASNNYVLGNNDWIYIPLPDSGSNVNVINDSGSIVKFKDNRSVLVDSRKLNDKFIITDMFYWPSSSVIHKPHDSKGWPSDWSVTQAFSGSCDVKLYTGSVMVLSGSLRNGFSFTGSIRLGYTASFAFSSSNVMQFQIK